MFTSDPPENFSEDNFKKLQKAFRELLGGLADYRPVASSGAESVAVGKLSTIPYSGGSLSVIPLPFGRGAAVSFQGSTRDVTLLRLSHLLAAHRDLVRRCPEPDCSRLFYRERRQRYCSKRCVNRANKREARRIEKVGARAPRRKPRR
jgi:hypothetical protein